MRTIPSSELITNSDGSIFHLHLHPQQLADVVILVGDPARVELVASYFDSVECRVQNREFCTITGEYQGRRMSAISTGIGCDNIDIVMTEIDALANIDLSKRVEKSNIKQLTIVRLGTSGAVQSDIKVGDMILSHTSVGFDGVIHFYEGGENICDKRAEGAFMEFMKWGDRLATPYFVESDKELVELFSDFTRAGITISANGFYAPQGRYVRLKPIFNDMITTLEAFEWQGLKITNFEMEGSALASLARMMGHRATTICTIIAQRAKLDACPDYAPFVERMIKNTLERLKTI